MKKEELYNVWYASQERANSSSKTIVYDAIGELIINYESNAFKFKSETTPPFLAEKPVFISKEIIEVSYKHQTLNWKVWLLLCSAITSYQYALTGSLLYPIVMLSLGGSIGLLWASMFKWVKVKFKDEQEKISTIYFADRDFRGWSGMFGGNRKLYKIFLKLAPSTEVIA